jgi:tetratricopeptide (TPR) repeat protein
VFDDDQYALRWMDYAPYDDPRRQARLRVTRAFIDGGVDAGAAAFDREAAEDPDLLDEGRVNALGYVLLRRDAVDQAVWVFERNTLDYPESSNVWDSYGEALRAAGRLEESIANYGRSIELDPSNEAARAFIEEMEAELAAPGT